MQPDLLPLFLGTAYACLGLSGLRLARLDGAGYGWVRLCIAGLMGALLEWYAIYEAAFLEPQPNDLIGSLLALATLGAFLEFSRKTVSRRFQLKPWAQVFSGLVIAAAGTFAVTLAAGGIYERFVVTQRSVGLTLAGLSLLVIMPCRLRGAAWARGAGLAMLAGVLAASATPGVWPFIAGVGIASLLLRIVYVVRHKQTARPYGIWAALEYIILAALLLFAAASAHQRGERTMELEERQLLSITQAAAAAFAPDNVDSLTGSSADENNQAYEMTKRRLLTIQQIAHATTDTQRGSRFAYLMAKRDGNVIFLADQPDDPVNPVAPGDVYHEASGQLRQSLIDGTPFIEGPLPDRYGIWVSAFAPVRNASGELLAMLGIDFDAGDWAKIEERARLSSILNWTLITVIALSVFATVGIGLETQQQLRQSEQMFRIAADYTATWEYWVSPRGKMRHTSPACEKITGYKPAVLQNHPRRLLKIVHRDDRRRVADHLRSCSSDAPACEFDYKIVRKDGSVAWISHSCQPVYDADGRWNGRRASNRDITALRQTELTLARQDRLQAGCHQALRRLLGLDGEKYVRDALDYAAQAGNCSCAVIFRLAENRTLSLLESSPRTSACNLAWESIRDVALPILSIGEVYELLPRETQSLAAPMKGAHLAILPLLDRGDLWGIAVFAAPPEREPWSRAEITTLATLASGFSLALTARS